MQVKMILPALTEAISPYFRPIKYSLFPPLGLATLAGYLHEDDQVNIQDEHVEQLDLNDDPELVVIQVYITSAHRAYELADQYRAKGAYVALGGLHVTSLPDEAAPHADSIFLGPGEVELTRKNGSSANLVQDELIRITLVWNLFTRGRGSTCSPCVDRRDIPRPSGRRATSPRSRSCGYMQ